MIKKLGQNVDIRHFCSARFYLRAIYNGLFYSKQLLIRNVLFLTAAVFIVGHFLNLIGIFSDSGYSAWFVFLELGVEKYYLKV